MFLKMTVRLSFLLLIASTMSVGCDHPKERKVLILGIDGLRPDALEKAWTPHLDKLRTDGLYSNRVQATDSTWSASGWSSLLHGVWRDKHGVKDNKFEGRQYNLYPDIFTRMEQTRSDLFTVRVSSWDKIHAKMPTTADIHIDTSGDVETLRRASSYLSRPELDAMFVYFVGVDSPAGHSFGFHPTIPEYISAIELVDRRIGALMKVLKKRSRYSNEEWLIMVVTDHGGHTVGKKGKHGQNRPEDRTTFMIASGPTVKNPGGTLYPEPGQVDLFPTVFEHMNIPVKSSWNLDGKPIDLASAGAPVPVYGRNLILNGDAELNRGFRNRKVDAMAKQWIDVGDATVIRSVGGNHYSGGRTAISSLVQTIDLSSFAGDIDSGKGVRFTLSASLGGYKRQDDHAVVTARWRKKTSEAAFTAPNGKIYFFNGDRYDRFDPSSNRVDRSSRSIAAWWPGLVGNIDAAFHWKGKGKIYFFKGDNYYRYDWNRDRVDAGYPRNIAGHWPGLANFTGGARDLDAAIDWGDGRIFFFKGNEYIQYDKDTDRAARGYPRHISDQTWEDLSVWPTGIDAAVNWPSNQDRAYFFKQGAYVRYSKSRDAVDNGTWPRTVNAKTWKGLFRWHRDHRTVSLFKVKALHRNNRTGVMKPATTGTIPRGTREVEIEVLFRRTDGTENNATADDVSLILD